MKQPAGPRLQRELQWRLIPPLVAIVVLVGLIGAYTAHYYVNRVFDRWLLDAANSLAEEVRFTDGRAVVELSAQAEKMLVYDAVDRTYYAVTQDGRHVQGREGLPMHGTREYDYGAGARAFNARFQGRDVRIVSVPVQGEAGARASVAMGETLIKRDRAERELLLALAPVFLLAAVTVWVIGATVRRTLQPLEQIAARWNERSHASLEPLDAHDIPRELEPFALALNGLLARVRDMLERERQFAATAAHQLRTPLTGLQLGLARARSASTLDEARLVLGELSEATQRTARLVQQLLALGRLDPEMRIDLDLADLDLGSIAREVGEIYLDVAGHKGIDMELHCPESAVPVRAQPDLIREALANLIDNAVRYTPSGGRVAIEVGAHPPEVTVTDSGRGIPLDERAKVFERFFRGRGSSGEGSGLGLAIVKEIAVLHGAQVMLESSDRGGTVVRLRFG